MQSKFIFSCQENTRSKFDKAGRLKLSNIPKGAKHLYSGVDEYSYSWLTASFFWTHKNVFLFPADVILDISTGKNHYMNGNSWWGSLTMFLVLLPNIVCAVNTIISKKGNWLIDSIKQLLFLHVFTFFR